MSPEEADALQAAYAAHRARYRAEAQEAGLMKPPGHRWSANAAIEDAPPVEAVIVRPLKEILA